MGCTCPASFMGDKYRNLRRAGPNDAPFERTLLLPVGIRMGQHVILIRSEIKNKCGPRVYLSPHCSCRMHIFSWEMRGCKTDMNDLHENRSQWRRRGQCTLLHPFSIFSQGASPRIHRSPKWPADSAAGWATSTGSSTGWLRQKQDNPWHILAPC